MVWRDMATQAELDAATTAMAGVYRSLFISQARMNGATTANTFFLFVNNFQTPTGGAGDAATQYIDPADYAVAGKTTKLRLRGIIDTNDTAPASDFTFALVPITGVSGTVNSINPTYGAAIASTPAISAPGADTQHKTEVEFTCPSAGYYAVVLITTATLAAGVIIVSQLHVRNV